MGFYGNATGGFGMPKILEIVDNNGNTIIGTVTDSEITLDATRDDVKVGKTFASTDGIQEGIDTRTYRTNHGVELILPGESFSILLDKYDTYDYTKFQAMIAEFNTTELDSINISKISINDAVYSANSNTKLSNVTKNTSSKSINLNMTNSTDHTYIIHYNTYKEE
ncbi:MAG: hypothetical protein PUE12_18240 [Oscillospiraceae bacterium]|nr:hypothetical protein [Oscillospiraceae bacterium]